MNTFSKVSPGLAVAFAAGALVGILYAPDKGERTRRRMTRTGRRVFHAVDDTIQESKDNLAKLQDQFRDNLEQANDKIERLSRYADS